MVETVLSIPFLLLALFSIIYFGRFFYMTQVITYAAQEGARVASRVPNLQDADVRSAVAGFATDGTTINTNSVVYNAFSSARLLTNGATGNLPTGAKVKLLPWDSDGSVDDQIPTGTVAVRIQYPFKFLGDDPNFPGDLQLSLGTADPIVTLGNFELSEKATASQEIYQEIN
jgi:Flp pilus assembly protein TadG